MCNQESNVPDDRYVREALQYAVDFYRDNKFEFLMPEHLLLGILGQDPFRRAVSSLGGDVEAMRRYLVNYLDTVDRIDDDMEEDDEAAPVLSVQMEETLGLIAGHLEYSSATQISVPAIINQFAALEYSHAAVALSIPGVSHGELMAALIEEYSDAGTGDGQDEDYPDSVTDDGVSAASDNSRDWEQYVTRITGEAGESNPLIGRDEEIERTVRVLCRKDKNNPLHVGPPGVGKTALVYGLARRIREGNVPACLHDARIYRLDVGDLLAGTHYRGDMEKRLKEILKGAASIPGTIIYIDEVHTIVGAGAIGEGALDASNMLKPYLENGSLRFIGSTTPEEYSRYLERSKSLVRRFQQIDVREPSVGEAVGILMQLRHDYEQYHGVRYTDEALEYAVNASARHITDRCLPDKAIDLIDEAGAYRQTHPCGEGPQTVDKELVSRILAKMCRVESLAVNDDDTAALRDLSRRISAQVFGQDDAVRAVTEAVQMSKAGLTDETKPLASLLFVGPTGVGKTEVAKVLAAEMGVELVRFDMSEYTERHAVAKLIGAPAGYVGYDDGGLLTDAVRRAPSCVLLLDEIEKAHADIYNILLQVMDYGRLTDNKGRQTDFRNVVIIMTSNAGAQYAAQASVGFGSTVPAGAAMMKEVKRTFRPEFINRLSGTIIFNEMSPDMASLILDKKLGQLRAQLAKKNVTLRLSDEARTYLLKQGYTRRYGAREMDRVIASRLKPLLMREILFGTLAGGRIAEIIFDDDRLIIKP